MNSRVSTGARRPRPCAQYCTDTDGREAGRDGAATRDAFREGFDAFDVLRGAVDDATVEQVVKAGE